MDANLETGQTANREYKDSVFSLLLNGNDAAAISVANSFLGTNYGPDTKVLFTTIKNALSKGRVNDLAFILDDRLIVLVEHQSTINDNMPYRMLQYIAETYRWLHAGKDEYRKDKFTLQRPIFIVLYNGAEDMEDMRLLRLSDMFPAPTPEEKVADDGLASLELTVKMYNINRGRNENIIKSCAAIREYSIFTSMVREYRRTMSLEAAIQKAVVDCIDQNVLKEFLLKYKGEVINMLLSEWNMDIALEVSEEEGAMKERRKIAKNLIAQGLGVDATAKATGLTVDDVLRLK